MSWLLLLLLVGVVCWAITRFYLRGEDLSRYDLPGDMVVGADADASHQHFETVELLREFASQDAARPPGTSRLAAGRARMDEMGDSADLTGIEIRPVDVNGVPGEWVLAAGADPHRRLLYLHGGAFVVGSPRSHRAITTKLSRISGACVLAIDYRLQPEHRRLHCLEDCQTAYRWVLDQGPNGPAPLSTLFVAGDSAGGNLTLVVLAWARDAGLRAADAAVALSPATDGTLSSPSILDNLESDHMLGPAFGRLARLPRGLVLWFAWFASRVRPSDPRVSPAHGELSGLPPTLVHASRAEMLLDDARRYVNKARAQGSVAELQTWPHMLHVWHVFEQNLPEARDAFDQIAEFLDEAAPRQAPPAVDA